MRRGTATTTAAAGLAGLLALLPLGAQSQETDPSAPEARLTIGQQIAVEDGDLIGITPLDLNLRTGSRVQTIQFSLSAPFRLHDPDEDKSFALGDPQARLLLRRGARNSAIEAELGYRENDLDEEILFDDLSNEFVTLDGGRVAQTDARLTYVFGREAKLGGEFGLSWIRRDYSGTTDPDLDDSETRSGNVAFYLEPTPLVRARILAEASRTDGEVNDSRSDRYGVGASLQVDKLTNLDVELARTHIRREEGDGTVEQAEGPSLRLGLTRSRPLGDWSLSFGSDPGTAGRRENFNIGRTLELRRFTLTGQVGVTRFQDNYDPIFQIAYNQKLTEMSQVQASLRRAAVTDNDGDEALNTDITANYSRQISAVSSIAANIRYRESEVQSGDREDARSVSFGLDYSRALPNDFSLVAGANVIRSKDSDGTHDDEERVYLGVNRSFSFLR
ncbi:hypothetical protein PARHAE_03960 [Paracoccus haematequi]|uniref:Uncharacterized protein n=1 Tax=Paracoccus haematequi TaxID=2491866 RepID=A0A3S5D4C1_9RHOB|nr:DUF481 domain-containing protein [Paracoccus haematequi]VDS10741.1 hypothetical protein PARHAE_03960 [Paracoccus haematequi]